MARSGWISGNILAKAILISLSLWEFQEANALLTDCVCASTTCYQCACSSAPLCDITMKILECVFLMNDQCAIDLISCPSASCNEMLSNTCQCDDDTCYECDCTLPDEVCQDRVNVLTSILTENTSLLVETLECTTCEADESDTRTTIILAVVICSTVVIILIIASVTLGAYWKFKIRVIREKKNQCEKTRTASYNVSLTSANQQQQEEHLYTLLDFLKLTAITKPPELPQPRNEVPYYQEIETDRITMAREEPQYAELTPQKNTRASLRGGQKVEPYQEPIDTINPLHRVHTSRELPAPPVQEVMVHVDA